MKIRTIFAGAALLLLAACSVEPGWETFSYSAAIPVEITSVDDALSWLAGNIAYRSDSDVHGRSYWQTPDETYRLRTGDCEDFALLFMYLVRTDLGLDSRMLIVGYDSTSPNHAIVVIGDEWYETTGGFRITDRSRYHAFQSIDYDTSLWQSAAYHSGLL